MHILGFSSFYALILSAEIKHNDLWRVGTGENGKEVDVQKNRNRREAETIYQAVQGLPSNPKEPWDLEMDYDDTLTPEIPIEHPPDADGSEIQVSLTEHVNTVVAPAPSVPQVGGGSATEPDLELLAVLLENPELVFALTSGQAGNLSSEETVKLFDMIKAGGAGLAGSLNGLGGKVEKVEVSLPSPTPSSNPGTASMGNRVAYTDPGVPTVAPLAEKNTRLVQHQNQATNFRTPQQQASVPFLSHHHPFTLSQTKIVVTMENIPAKPPSLPSLPAASGPSMWVETMNNLKPAQSISLTSNPPERRPVSISTVNSCSSSSNTVQCLIPWRVRQSLVPHPPSRVNQNNCVPPYGGPVQPQLRSGPPRERNEYLGDEGFESWSPENSHFESQEHMSGRNYSGARMNSGRDCLPNKRSRQRNSSVYGDRNRNGNGRWR
ncbi:ZINC FINGER CCCH DOMAIN-CONTAINING PROTEIN 6-RELATED [Salix viminalis]|uniref:ZINC FINGER CCCH DOMAIN-CONTAINING PROTEIN 6-RELATED n=1 Tax=Salix viminalis TaxID=40686 RepID=A0A9Q0NS31_SALVM|nr:ZINC FINGER CCCH DOMAIN-CONTAINING PROTEIN 6-RELATED [Salix viminalis]